MEDGALRLVPARLTHTLGAAAFNVHMCAANESVLR